jgi:hypothetical protein
MKNYVVTICISIFILSGLVFFFQQKQSQLPPIKKQSYWFILHRKSNKEYLYKGTPGERKKSVLLKTFSVKTGIPEERPTPLPQLVGRDYWLITDKASSKDNPETAPYFLTLNIPAPESSPYGPSPYDECNGQCNWILPGAFGLHGVNGDKTKLAEENPGSSGCIRHTDEDITYLYNLLDLRKEKVRYYIEDR